MKSNTKLLYQLILWLVVWVSQWAIQSFSSNFIINNISLLLLQVIIILLVIYWLAPKFIFQKKYLLFGVISFLFISFFAYLSFILTSDAGPAQHPPHPPHIAPFNGDDVGEPSLLDKINRLLFPPSKLFVNYLLITIAHFIATLLEGYNFIRKKEEEAIVIKNENLETELKLLKSQINPHFLFNALNNIYALTNIDTRKTQQSIINLSDMLRYVLYECDQNLVSLSKEISYIENYIKLFSLKSCKALSIKLDFNNINSNLKIAPMLLIPFVENAFKHSNIENEDNAFIIIKADETLDNKLCFLVKNSKPKMELYKDKVGGIGLVNVQKRLNILYPDNNELIIENYEDEYHIKLLIKLTNDY